MAAIVYWAPKREARRTEWEDGASYSARRQRAAVADGASSSFDAQRWAAALCFGFCRNPPRTLDAESFEAWVSRIAEAWHDVVGSTLDDAAWYVGEAASRGSFATFCGVHVSEVAGSLTWRAMAVGDTCVFHVRDDQLVTAFPLDDPDAFASTPPLLTSVAYLGDHGARHLQTASGVVRPGDHLMLATDALAAWALARGRDVGDSWRALSSVDHAGFDRMVGVLRDAGELADDDTTLLRWTIDP